MYETFDTPFYLQRSIEVHYTPFTAEWQISGKNVVGQNNVAAYSTYGTSRANAYKILEDSSICGMCVSTTPWRTRTARNAGC